MSNSKHFVVRDAILAALVTLASGNVKPGRDWPMAEQDAQLVKVYLDTSAAKRTQIHGYPVDWTTRVRCEFLSRGTGTVTAETAADALATEGFGLVMADASLGGLCMDCYQIGIAWDTAEADTSVAVVQIVFEALHRTAYNNITA